MASRPKPQPTREVLVAAAVIRDSQGRLLLAQRPEGKHLAGLWEFPGGKIESGESADAALFRELNEELGIRINHSEPMLSLTHHYPGKTVRLLIRLVETWQGEPRGLEGQLIDWVDLPTARRLPMPAADRPILQVMPLDPHYSLASGSDALETPEAFVRNWDIRLAQGSRLLGCEVPEFDERTVKQVLAHCALTARQAGARWLIHGPPALAVSSGADGVHLSGSNLQTMNQRPLSDDFIVAGTCQDARELERAGRLGLDFVCLELDFAASSSAAVAWSRLSEQIAESPLPVMAQGELQSSDLQRARAIGAFGLASTQGFQR